MGKMKDLATNLYIVGLADKEGIVGEIEIFGPNRVAVQLYLENLGFTVLWLEELEGNGE